MLCSLLYPTLPHVIGATLSILRIVKFSSPNNAMNAQGGTYERGTHEWCNGERGTHDVIRRTHDPHNATSVNVAPICTHFCVAPIWHPSATM